MLGLCVDIAVDPVQYFASRPYSPLPEQPTVKRRVRRERPPARGGLRVELALYGKNATRPLPSCLSRAVRQNNFLDAKLRDDVTRAEKRHFVSSSPILPLSVSVYFSLPLSFSPFLVYLSPLSTSLSSLSPPSLSTSFSPYLSSLPTSFLSPPPLSTHLRLSYKSLRLQKQH